ncbi:PilW family protein [Solimicrobium silvestre]|uniref:Prepilin-type N-terminal cleavage/methylation domain n=1 Tax=Solimicrobium silvestre TaxID=2099400 RepID=A0A2S9GTI1_9BURK|nr:PilW family protein [Solimicrobium silvestre]PRC91020.1 Prepilin-type N-terminal cleavage/methylation domain [Solimicrobium silvestre]
MTNLTFSPHASMAPGLRKNGFSLIELMVAVTIGLFITLGLSQVFLSMYSTSKSQNSLAQFQDNERLALVMLTNTVELAGYFASPLTTTLASLQATAYTNTDGSVFSNGIGVVGKNTYPTTGTSDSLNVYYQSSGNDGVINCQGQPATTGTSTVFINSFTINSKNELVCAVTPIISGTTGSTTSALVLASNVASMTILYGVDVLGTGTTSSYLTATALNNSSPSLWPNVRTVQITLNFYVANVFNLATAPTTTTAWVQTINIMRAS